MAWIELHQSLPTHHRTMALMDALDLDVPCAVGHLACLWLWALDNAPSGVLAFSARTIARAARWTGEPEAFVAALREAGFLDGDTLHDWDDYAGKLIDQRRRNAEKQKHWREQHKAGTSLPYREGHNRDVTVTSPARTAATVPNPTRPNQPPTANAVGTPDADAPADPAPATRAATKPTKYGDFIDALTAAGVPYESTAADARACKAAGISAGQLAEVYVALARGDFGDDWQRDHLCVATAAKAWNAYQTARTVPRRNHQPPRSVIDARYPLRGVDALMAMAAGAPIGDDRDDDRRYDARPA